ncbi:MAG TPA: BamA/TamA family outer membrane protein [Chryseolinea sp.]|nr:BamA/TamA family outer membrane protein [Chryseolinea sp.]
MYTCINSFFKYLPGIVLLILLFPDGATAQKELTGTSDTTCVQKELGDILRAARNKPPKASAENAGSLLLLPIIGSNPATGFMIGVGGQYAFKRPGEQTLFSLLSGSAQLTTKSQALLLLKNNIYTKNNRIFFSGDWRYLIFSQSTYGLGTKAPEGGVLDYQYSLSGMETTKDSLTQPMKFNFLRIYQSASYNFGKGFYAGIGYNLDYYFNIKDEKLRLDPSDSLITSHYAYSKYYGFDTQKYYSSALNVNLIFDTRDNMINPFKGYYALISWRGSMKLLGNKTNSNFFHVEWRSFHPLSVKNPRHLMAFWLLGDFSPAGEFPYMILPATAYDQRSRSARGYTQGRFRGNEMVYGEAEYRFPLSPCGGVWGGVLFVNATTASNPVQSVKLFQSIKPAYGLGLRVMVDKKSRTNLAVDFGFGDKSSGFYLAASETF